MATWREELRRLVAAVDDDDLLDLVAELRRGELEAEMRIRNGRHDSANDLRCYSAAEVAEMLGVGRSRNKKKDERDLSWVYRHADDLGGRKIGGRLVFPEHGVRRFLERSR